jgi:transposase
MALKDKYVVVLSPVQRHLLEAMTRTGTHAASALLHARILLMADQGEGGDGDADEAVAEAIGASAGTVARVRKRFVVSGLDDALHRRRPTGRQYRKLDGAQEARLVALACSEPPDGRGRWTLRLLADKLVELEVVASIDPATVHRTLKKTTSSRG